MSQPRQPDSECPLPPMPPLLSERERWWLVAILNALLVGVIWGLIWWGASALWPSTYSPKVPIAVALAATFAYVRGRHAERAAKR